MTVEDWLGKDNTLGISIWEKKYRQNNESFDDWLDRVSGKDDAVKNLIRNKAFLFGGRILSNRGITDRKSTLSNCYVLTVEDSIESIYQCCSDIARTYSYGGGVGVDISKLRPRGAFVNNSAKETTGAVSFMKTFDTVTSTIGQNGRRGALMLSLDVRHPDVEEFINIKANTDQITSANISVRVNDDFMSAVEHDEDYILRWPCDIDLSKFTKEYKECPYNTLTYLEDHTNNNKIFYIKKVKARELFNQLVKNNWSYAEPGILYWDQIKNWNMMQQNEDFEYAGINPCAEEPLVAGGACLLGAMNISYYVKDGHFYWGDFDRDVKIATKALNDVLVEGTPLHPLKVQTASANTWRAIGLGLFDLAGALVKLGIKYGSKKAQEFADKVTHQMLVSSFEKSCELNPGNIPFDNLFKSDIYNSHIKSFISKCYEGRYPLNSQLLTIAPTGTISTMINAFSGGGEPAFALSYKRTTKSLHGKDVTYDVHPKLVQDYMNKHNCTIEQLPEEFISSGDIHWKDRIDMQAALQKNIDASISSTINLPESATEKDVYDIYMYAWKAGLKGVTIFRQGCARDAILKVEEKGKKEEKKKDTIPYNSIVPVSRKQIGVTHGSTFCKKCACGTLYITVNKDKEGNIVEVFTHTSKGGICQANLNAETRMASLALRSGVKVSEVTDQLKGISCPACTATKAKGKKIDGISCADIIAKTIEEFQLNNIKMKSEYPATEEEAKHYSTKYDKCPGCGEYTLIHEAGCVLCGNCGYSKCE